LEERVRRAAAIEGESVSEFLRHAAADRADRTLAARPSEQLRDVIGVVHGGGGRARQTGASFTDAVAERRQRG
jgi:hypothetical protein